MLHLFIFFLSFFGNIKNTTHTAIVNYYVISDVKIKCIKQCDIIGSDQVYISVQSSFCTSKSTIARSFNAGISKAYTEIGPGNGSVIGMWCMGIGDKFSVYEKDLADADDLIFQVSLTTAIGSGTIKTFTGTGGTGKYEISFRATKI